MVNQIATASAGPRARTSGVFYLLYFLIAILAQFFNGRGFTILGYAANLVAFGCYIVLTLLFYYLFKPVNRQISLIAAFCSLVGCVLGAIGLFNSSVAQVSPLFLFGPYCILLGYLIFRSTFLPRMLGVLLVIAGLGWLVYLLPIASHLSSYIEVLGIVAEGLLMLWLLVKGVNVQRWKEQAGALQ